MSQAVAQAIKSRLGHAATVIETFRGDDRVIVDASQWRRTAELLKTDPEFDMDHFLELTAVDYLEREPEVPRFDVVLIVRSNKSNQRVILKTRVRETEELDSLVSVWVGANWAEREIFDMFGIRFREHPDLRRILMYPEFEGYPLRKDYPIDKTQPLIEYRQVEGTSKLPPFGKEEGQPWTRIDWQARLAGEDLQVSPAISLQQGQRKALSESE